MDSQQQQLKIMDADFQGGRTANELKDQEDISKIQDLPQLDSLDFQDTQPDQPSHQNSANFNREAPPGQGSSEPRPQNLEFVGQEDSANHQGEPDSPFDASNYQSIKKSPAKNTESRGQLDIGNEADLANKHGPPQASLAP